MTLDDKFKEVKKQVGLFLVQNGFKKVKSHYRREFTDSRCLFQILKPRGYSHDKLICWQLVGGIFFNALDPIFRDGGLADEDSFSSFEKRFNTTVKRGVSFWEITPETNVADHIDFFKTTNHDLFEQLDQAADIRIYTKSQINYYLENTRNVAANGLLAATALAKMSGRKEDYESLLKIIDERDIGMSYMNQKLTVIKENKTAI